MTDIIAEPIFAAAGEAVIYLLVVVFTLISWIVNLANSQKQKNNETREQSRPPGRRNQRRERTDERIQNEIEVFLQEVRGKRDSRRPTSEPELVAEVIPEEEPHHESLRRQLEEKKKLAAREAEKAARKKARLRPKVGTKELPHLESKLSAGEEPAIAVGKPIALQPLTEAERSAKRAEANAREMQAVYGAKAIGNVWTEIFRDPKQVRQAIVLNEILAKPKSLR